jgi:hypothetical protein
MWNWRPLFISKAYFVSCNCICHLTCFKVGNYLPCRIYGPWWWRLAETCSISFLKKSPFSGLLVLFRLLVPFFWKILHTFDVEFSRLIVVRVLNCSGSVTKPHSRYMLDHCVSSPVMTYVNSWSGTGSQILVRNRNRHFPRQNVFPLTAR